MQGYCKSLLQRLIKREGCFQIESLYSDLGVYRKYLKAEFWSRIRDTLFFLSLECVYNMLLFQENLGLKERKELWDIMENLAQVE